LQSAFRKISRVANLAGGTKWYLSEDCLLAAKRVMYTVEYRRFYLRDLESIVVWPNRVWLLRAIIPGSLLLALAALLWQLVDFTTGAVFGVLGLVWAGLELALGPTAEARIRTTGATVDLPLVKRMRRARKILVKIDAAVRAARGSTLEEPATAGPAAQPATPFGETPSEAAPAAAPIRDLT
jgi:hypothetical protein